MMKIHPDNVDSLLIVKRTSNDSKMYKVKKVKIDEILNILNDNRTRKSSILSNVSSDDSCSKKSELLTKKRLMAQFAVNSTNQSRENFSRLFHFPDFKINTDSMDDSQHLKNTIGLFSRNSLENRTKSCLPLKKRKIKSTFQATKPFKPHNTNVSVVTGDKEKLILIYKSEQSQLLTDNDEKLRKKIEIALKQDEDGDLPLHIAVAHKNLASIGSFCKLIQQAGKTVDRFNKKKFTPLHLCVKMNYSKGVRKLIKMGADMNLSDGKGNSAVHLAVSYSHFECFDVILKTCSSMENCKPNLDSHNYEGLTPLHTSVQKQNIEMVRKLLKAGADPDSKDYKSGRTPLFFAVENKNEDIIKLLLENKASIDIQNFAGHTPFLVANGRKYPEICKLLVDQGADSHGMTFDDLACNYKTSNIKYQLKNKLVANQSS
ncbi:B-cell lymphoma 3 protein [Octopus sinensis]|nr:B-cell lymphoma 3 protein [Octopus sinensis]